MSKENLGPNFNSAWNLVASKLSQLQSLFPNPSALQALDFSPFCFYTFVQATVMFVYLSIYIGVKKNQTWVLLDAFPGFFLAGVGRRVDV